IMDQAIPKPRSELSKYAPRIITIQIRPDKIGDLIGPKGKTIRGIQEQTGAEINVDDNGLVTISAVGEGGERARDMVQALVQERSEERRVGKECRCRWGRDEQKKKREDRARDCNVVLT